MINVKDLHKAYEDRIDEKYKDIIKEFENFIDEQLIETDGESKITKWDFLMIVDKAIGGLTTENYMIYKEAFEHVESRLNIFGHMISKNEHGYTKEAMLLKCMLERYYNNGYLVKPSWSKTIYIER